MDSVPSIWHLGASLPRHAFSTRDAARAGDVWRAFQEVAVEASTRAGWPPLRYREEDVAFVMRSMTVVHAREVLYGERLDATTWVRSFRRGIFSSREVRLRSERGAIASASQTWVHVRATRDDRGHWKLVPDRAPASLEAAFPVHDAAGEQGAPVTLPAFEARAGQTHELEVEAWITSMDPLDHVNHPAYVDWADEHTSRLVRRAGLDPVDLAPVAESATYHRGVQALERARIRTRVVGIAPEGVVQEHAVDVDDQRCAAVTTVRRLLGVEHETLRAALAGG